MYYDSSEIDKLNATYNLIISQHSNGKVFCICRKIIDAYIEDNIQSSYIRRLKEEIVGMAVTTLFDLHSDYIKQKTNSKFNGVHYYRRAFYLCRYEKKVTGEIERVATDKKPFCRCYAISIAAITVADPGAQRYILFDEFITRRRYINNEFVHFQNLLSSLTRDRSDTTIYMLANPVDKSCPYFAEMGVSDIIQNMKPGTIAFYQDDEKKRLSIAIEYCAE